ncbi:uncharacterized protein RHTO_03862 [Rhodotorula toruloides NP11]|uniref:Uncharacterized protein n=1 Tax=Rhodotorula toruloides (strain NP11) TaxID=1130832 RepID=M7X8R0_RHOT1|nr:uncharacterized protein RHTO_03862 [Rhodotorula toruloides NP11]EMS20064.1 hypothetical protein RHTO_03862 [Rhodotorula toruloides NP11]
MTPSRRVITFYSPLAHLTGCATAKTTKGSCSNGWSCAARCWEDSLAVQAERGERCDLTFRLAKTDRNPSPEQDGETSAKWFAASSPLDEPKPCAHPAAPHLMEACSPSTLKLAHSSKTRGLSRRTLKLAFKAALSLHFIKTNLARFQSGSASSACLHHILRIDLSASNSLSACSFSSVLQLARLASPRIIPPLPNTAVKMIVAGITIASIIDVLSTSNRHTALEKARQKYMDAD